MNPETFIPASSSLDQCTYDETSQDLTILFRSGETYTYRGVPQSVWFALKHSGSAGSYFYRQIRNTYAYEQA